jgi:hypothetical protein
MDPTPAQLAFLNGVESLNEGFAGIRIGSKWESLAFPFWNMREILDGLTLREEWGIPSALAPFGGDCSLDLFCLDLGTNEVVHLDPDRNVAYRWPSSSAFTQSLTPDEPPLEANNARLVNYSLSPKLKEAAQKLLAKRRAKKNDG